MAFAHPESVIDSNQLNPEELLIAREEVPPNPLSRTEMFMFKVRHLSPLYRTILYLRRDGESFSTIGEMFGKNKQWVHWRYTQALKQLQE